MTDVLVLGGAGSVGAVCVIQLVKKGFSVVVVDHSEIGLFQLEKKLAELPQSGNCKLVLGSVLDQLLLRKLNANKFDIVIHAAAYKHVAIVEDNHHSAIAVNIFGLLSVLDSLQSSSGRFVLISTDKAVNPLNFMGVTKRLGELCVRYFSSMNSSFDWSIVRFGNVLNSSGSVLPIFQKQLSDGLPLTVTHEDANRYLMTLDDAAKFVLKVSQNKACSKKTLVKDMGSPIKILDLAKSTILQKGLIPVVDPTDYSSSASEYPIKIIGLRPGEKISEELWYERGGEVCDLSGVVNDLDVESESHASVFGERVVKIYNNYRDDPDFDYVPHVMKISREMSQ